MRTPRWAGLALVLALLPSVALAQRVDGIAAVVNEDVILQSDVEEQLALFVMRSQINPDSVVADSLRRQILNQLIDEKLIVAEAKRQGMTTSPTEIERQIDQAVEEAKQRFGGEQGYAAQLARENMTEAKLRERYRGELERQLLAQRLLSKQLPKKTVTLAEAQAYFKANHEKFPRVPSEVHLLVIQIPASADSASDAQSRARALAARKRIVGGEKFAKVASEVSDDPSSARSGGDLGFFTRGSLDPAVEKAAFALKDNEVSTPVRSTFGWHILQVLERDTVKTIAGKDSTDLAGVPVIELHARHILIRVPVDDDDIARSRKLAERVRLEAVKGTNFGTLAHRYSKYQGQQGDDGDIGFVSMGTLQPAIRSGLDSLEAGQISEVLTNAVGFNIFKVVDRKPEREYQMEELKDDLSDLVAEMKQRERYEDWVKTLRAKAHIEIRRS